MQVVTLSMVHDARCHVVGASFSHGACVVFVRGWLWVYRLCTLRSCSGAIPLT